MPNEYLWRSTITLLEHYILEILKHAGVWICIYIYIDKNATKTVWKCKRNNNTPNYCCVSLKEKNNNSTLLNMEIFLTTPVRLVKISWKI